MFHKSIFIIDLEASSGKLSSSNNLLAIVLLVFPNNSLLNISLLFST